MFAFQFSISVRLNIKLIRVLDRPDCQIDVKTYSAGSGVNKTVNRERRAARLQTAVP